MGDGFSHPVPDGCVLADPCVQCCCLSTHWRMKQLLTGTQMVLYHRAMADSTGAYASEKEAKQVQSVKPDVY